MDSEDRRKLDAVIKIVEQTNLIDWNYKNADLVSFLKSMRDGEKKQERKKSLFSIFNP